jgi:Tfp pilus assembly protein PilX
MNVSKSDTSRIGHARAGFALLNALLLASVLTLALVTSINYTQASYRSARNIKYEAQVYNVARAGLVDAIAWFKRQKQQPVEVFAPTFNASNPLKGDTNDPYEINPGGADGQPHLGMVQEFEIDKEAGLWGRYEIGKITKLVQKKGESATYSIREYDAVAKAWNDRAVPYATSTEYEGVRDLTEDYGLQGKGLLWRIRSHGYVYRKDPNAPAGTHFYQYPNEVLDQTTLETEIFRLQIRDYGAAIVGNNGNDIIIRNTGGVSGGEGYALMYNTGIPTPAVPTNLMTSNQDSPYYSNQLKGQPPNALDWFEVFGVADASVIAGLADVKGDSHRDTGAAMALTYIKPKDGTLAFRDYRSDTPENPGNRPVSGGGILVVDGNMWVKNWNTNVFNGVIYVTGDLKIEQLTNFVGQFIVKGKIDWTPTDIEYNPAVLASIRMRLCQYRERRSALRVATEE